MNHPPISPALNRDNRKQATVLLREWGVTGGKEIMQYNHGDRAALSPRIKRWPASRRMASAELRVKVPSKRAYARYVADNVDDVVSPAPRRAKLALNSILMKFNAVAPLATLRHQGRRERRLNERRLAASKLLALPLLSARQKHAERCRFAVLGARLIHHSDLQETSRTIKTPGIPDRRAIKLAPPLTRNRRTEKGR